MHINLRLPTTEQYFVAQINEASPVPFIHPKLKNEAASPIPIEVYSEEQHPSTSWFQETKEYLKDNLSPPPIPPRPVIPSVAPLFYFTPPPYTFTTECYRTEVHHGDDTTIAMPESPPSP